MATLPFEFAEPVVDEHIEKIGLDVRPTIEIGMEKTRIYDLYRDVNEKYPDFFDTLQMSPSQFEIKKKFVVPGRGEAELATFAMTKRGFCVTIPRRIAALDSELDVPLTDETDKRIAEVLKIFLKHFPTRKVLRVGKVHDYVFDCGQTDSTLLVAQKFTKITAPKEIFVRFNLRTEKYNRVFQIEPVLKQGRTEQGTPEIRGFGIRVSIDFNNCNMSEALDIDQIRVILHSANDFHGQEAFELLNNMGGES